MKYFLFALITLALFSCSTYQKPQKKEFERTKIINKSYDDVWAGLIKWFSEHNTPIKNLDKTSGLISTEFSLSLANSEECVDCGSRGFGQTIDAKEGNFNVVIEKVTASSTKITVNTFFRATLETVNTTSAYAPPYRTPINCESTGVLEGQLFESIAK